MSLWSSIRVAFTGDFWIGCLLGKYYLSNLNDKSSVKDSVLEIIVILLSFSTQWIYLNCGDSWLMAPIKNNLLYTPTAVGLVWIFARSRGQITNVANKTRLLGRIGNMSAIGFLAHQVIIKYLKAVLARLSISITPLLLAGIAFLVTTAFIQIYMRFERRIRRLK